MASGRFFGPKTTKARLEAGFDRATDRRKSVCGSPDFLEFPIASQSGKHRFPEMAELCPVDALSPRRKNED